MQGREYIQPYVSAVPTVRSARWLDSLSMSIDVMRRAGYPGKLRFEDYHITIVYAQNEAQWREIKKLVLAGVTHQVTLKQASLFGPNEEHLVMEVDAPTLHQRNKLFMEQNQLETSFPEYRPHLTMYSEPSKQSIWIDPEMEHQLLSAARDEINKALEGKVITLLVRGEKLKEAKR